jgi:hypothetical protein
MYDFFLVPESNGNKGHRLSFQLLVELFGVGINPMHYALLHDDVRWFDSHAVSNLNVAPFVYSPPARDIHSETRSSAERISLTIWDTMQERTQRC